MSDIPFLDIDGLISGSTPDFFDPFDPKNNPTIAILRQLHGEQANKPIDWPGDARGLSNNDIHRTLTARMLMGDLQNDFKLSRDQAAGFVGNLAHESGGFSKLQEIAPLIPGSRGGYGYAQWTGPRRREFEAYAGQQGLDPASYEANYGNLKRELTATPEAGVLRNLRRAPDAETAARVVQDEFLRPGIPHTGSRVSQANALADSGFLPGRGAPVQTRMATTDPFAGLRNSGSSAPASASAYAPMSAPQSRRPMDDVDITGSIPAASSPLSSLFGGLFGGDNSSKDSGNGPSTGGLGGLGGRKSDAMDFRDFLSAVGLAMMSSPRGAPFANLPTIMATAQSQRARREDKLSAEERDRRDYQFRVQEAQRAQTNADRSYENQSLGDTGRKMQLMFPGVKPGTDEYRQKYKEMLQFGASSDLSKNPIYGRDKDGNPVILQIGPNGEAVQTKMPDGVQLSGKEPLKMDAGTHFVLMDPITRQNIGIVPKNVAETAAQKEVGEAEGKLRANAPQAISTADETLRVIGSARSHPGRESSTGIFSFLPDLPGTDRKGFATVHDQIKGRAFLQAFESLKGAGAITEQEGKAATAAITRLERGLSDKEYLEALTELENIVTQGKARASKFVQGAPGASAPAPTGSATGAPSRADLEAEARRRGLLR